jgi:4-amino-4-deoxy-L-arabinose transferase-like glycosyltransferase
VNFLHNYGLFINPAFNADEFVYMGRAWAFINFGTLEIPPDILYFQNPPLGWILLGLFYYLLPNLIFTYRARIFISVIFFGDTLAIYSICKKYYSRITGFIAVLILCFQTNFIPLERMVLLDNIGILFVLIAFALFLRQTQQNDKNPDIIITRSSAILFGLSVLIKFSFAFFITGFICFYFARRIYDKDQSFSSNIKKDIHKWFVWFLYFLIPIAIFLIYIIISHNLVNLIDNTLFQISRSCDSDFLCTFSFQFIAWFHYSPVFIFLIFFLPPVLMILSIIYVLFSIRQVALVSKKPNQKFIAKSPRKELYFKFLWSCFEASGLVILFLLFIISRQYELVYYVLPLIYTGSIFLAIIIISTFNLLQALKNESGTKESKAKKQTVKLNSLKSKAAVIRQVNTALIFAILSITLISIPYTSISISDNQDASQFSALDWVLQNVPKNSTIIVDDFFIAELKDQGYKYVQEIWFVDPNSIGNNSLNIDYFICYELDQVNNSFTAPAVYLAVNVKSFPIINIYKVQK